MIPKIRSRVYAIVVTHNASPWIENCLRSLMSSQYAVEAVVVDNGSTDATLSIVGQFPDVTCLQQDRNLGFGIANNIGICYALQQGADYVFLLNSDACVDAQTIGKLVNCARGNTDFGILSPVHLNEDGTELEYFFSRHIARATNPTFTKFLSDLYHGHLEPVYPVPFVNAAAWLVTRECLNRVGGFDPLFFPIYREDDDLCNRASFHGFDIGLVPSAVIFHARQKSGGTRISLWSALDRASARATNAMVAQLKDPSRSMGCQFLFLVGDTICQGLQSLLRGNFKRIAVLTMAAGKTLVRLLRIRRHRNMSLTPGPHWIRGDAS